MHTFNYRLLTATDRACLLLLTALLLLLASATARAQNTSVVAAGLRAPVKVIFTDKGNLLVAEAGVGPNTGRISLVERGGTVKTILDGLPSGLAAPNNDPSGPSGLLLQGNTLFITIGSGDVTRPGPQPGTEVPNPNGPSSPILSSVLAVRFNRDIDCLANGFALTRAHHFRLADGDDITLDNDAGAQANIEVVTDFRDYLPDANTIVRPSNPFGITQLGNSLYVTDASQNAIVKVNPRTGRAQTLTRFAPLENPTPLGPPRIDAVPNSIHRFGNQLLVTFLSGFPFPPGVAQVRLVDPQTGRNEPLVTGLRAAIDVAPLRTFGVPRLLVLEFSANPLVGAPGRLLRLNSPQATPEVITDELISPTSLAYDPIAREAFVTEIFTGRLLCVSVR